MSAAWIWMGLAVASGASFVFGQPWTGFLSARRYTASVRAHPLFTEANQVITAAWTTYFAIAALATALSNVWTSTGFAAAAPFLGWLSFVVGDRYPVWRTHRLETDGEGNMGSVAQSDLKAQIEGKGDSEIFDVIANVPGGLTEFLDQTVAGMADVLDADVAEDCVIGYEIDAHGATYAYRIEVCGQTVQAERRAPDDARVVLRLNVPDYLRLITGLLDGTQAFMSGRMHIQGDVMFAPRIGRMFKAA